MIKPVVSVCVITYNHETYIEQALISILNQKVNFDLEVIVSNDCSIDATDRIIQSIINTHANGHLISYFKQKTNFGMMPNFTFALERCQGKYIALCEGDDYWTDPLKLQKQVDFLEVNPDVAICFHRANLLKNEQLSLHKIPEPFHQESFKYSMLLEKYNFITTASVVFKKPKQFELYDWFNEVPFGDLALYKLLSDNGKIQCLKDNMCVYRIHDKGIYSGLSALKAQENYLKFYKLIFPILNTEEKQIVKIKMKVVIAKISQLKFPNRPLSQNIYKGFLQLKSK